MKKENKYPSPEEGEGTRRVGEGESGVNSLLSPLIRALPTFSLHGRRHSGFTLIELLVAVLNIGILAAIALPQYELAVKKSKATRHIISANAMIREVQAYYLANGTWPASLNDAGIDKPTSCDAWIEGSTYFIVCSRHYRVALKEGKIGSRYCYADKNDTFENKLCKTLTGASSPTNATGTYNRYDYH